MRHLRIHAFDHGVDHAFDFGEALNAETEFAPQSHADSLELQCGVSPAYDTRPVGPQANGEQGCAD